MTTFAIYGPGDLGERTAVALAQQLPAGDRLLLMGRRPDPLLESTRIVQLTASLSGRHPDISSEVVSLDAPDRVAEALSRHGVDVLLFAATRLTWWRTAALGQSAEALLQRAGFGFWLPVHLDLLQRMELALRLLPVRPWLVVLPFPDVTCVCLKRQGASRLVGAGNVDEIAAKVQLSAASRRGVPVADVEVRLVAHHSVQPPVFGDAGPLPPHALEVRVHGQAVPESLLPAWTWPSGTRSHAFTAASSVRLSLALAGDAQHSLHAPGPDGLPGGYPLTISAHGFTFDLPSGMDTAAAIAINESAQCYDGIADIRADGTVVFTDPCREALDALLGLKWAELPAGAVTAAADEQLARFKEATKR